MKECPFISFIWSTLKTNEKEDIHTNCGKGAKSLWVEFKISPENGKMLFSFRHQMYYLLKNREVGVSQVYIK